MKRILIAIVVLFCVHSINACDNAEQVIYNGVPWFDTEGNIVNAHGACVVEDGGRYWLFGEYKSHGNNNFIGFGCYSSSDLVNWKFERIVLPQQKDGILGPGRVGERVKVMKCPKTGEYIMLMHADNQKYGDPYIALATSPTINGEYTFCGPILYNGKPVKRWDMGTFQDEDGTGYLLIHHGPIYRLAEDYRSIVAQAANIKGMGESPAMFKKDGMYYLLTSNLTGWERNDNYYFTATNIEGPWKRHGCFCPEGTLTYNSQSTFVFPLRKDGKTTYIYMGDRWSYPYQDEAATCVWLPLTVDGEKLSVPEYKRVWSIMDGSDKKLIGREINVGASSGVKGHHISIPFKGRQIAIEGLANDKGGYGEIRILDNKGRLLHKSYVDFYSKVADNGLRFVSRKYKKGSYTLQVEVLGEHWSWKDKRGTETGSNGNYVNVDKVIVR